MNYFSKNILYLRKKSNLKQAHMESSVKVTRATWSNYENGMTEPSFDKLIEIAKFFRVSLDELLLVDLVKEPDSENEGKRTSSIRPYNSYSSSLEEMTLEDNNETTLWYLLREMRALRKDMDQLKNKVSQ